MSRLDRRGFLARTAAGALAASSATWRGPALLRAAAAEADDTVRDRLWLWGHPAGCHTQNPTQWGLPGSSRITPAEAAAWLGTPNLLMVRYDIEPKPPFGDYARPMRALRRVVWSIEGGGGADVGPVLELRGALPNLRGVIMDDYFGRVTTLAPPQWLAANGVQFPVTLSVNFHQPVAPTVLELTQTSWHSGDYRSRRVDRVSGPGSLAGQSLAAIRQVPSRVPTFACVAFTGGSRVFAAVAAGVATRARGDVRRTRPLPACLAVCACRSPRSGGG